MYYDIFCQIGLTPTEICDVEWSFPCGNFMIWTSHFQMPKRSLTWMMPLFHTHHNVCVIRTLFTLKTLFYCANADENGFLEVISRGNLLNSCTLWQSCTCAKEQKCPVQNKTKVDIQVFDLIHHKRHRLQAF